MSEKKQFKSILYYSVVVFVLFLLISSCFKNILLKRRCTDSIKVKCVEIMEKEDYYQSLYLPMWKGQYNGKEIIFETDYTTKKYDIDDTEIIKVNPNDLNEFVYVRDKYDNIIHIIFIIIFFIVNFYFFIIDFKKYKKEKFEKKLRE